MAVCSRARLSEQKLVCGKVAGVGVLILQDGEDVYAVERACPHEQADLSLGRVAEGRLHCPRHKAWFSLADGAISPGWSSRALRRYRILVGETEIFVDGRDLLPS